MNNLMKAVLAASILMSSSHAFSDGQYEFRLHPADSNVAFVTNMHNTRVYNNTIFDVWVSFSTYITQFHNTSIGVGYYAPKGRSEGWWMIPAKKSRLLSYSMIPKENYDDTPQVLYMAMRIYDLNPAGQSIVNPKSQHGDMCISDKGFVFHGLAMWE
ncbi:MAG: hypothetical protein HQK54_18455, partial [Oligoflexales bacterium]|nr:hypothetical protein [Oligoflexales bacterium]